MRLVTLHYGSIGEDGFRCSSVEGRTKTLSATRSRASVWLALNGAGLMLAGLISGALIPATPYPRLMLSAHNAGFTVSGTLSILAALLLSSSLSSLRAATGVLDQSPRSCSRRWR